MCNFPIYCSFCKIFLIEFFFLGGQLKSSPRAIFLFSICWGVEKKKRRKTVLSRSGCAKQSEKSKRIIAFLGQSRRQQSEELVEAQRRARITCLGYVLFPPFALHPPSCPSSRARFEPSFWLAPG